MKIPSLSRRTEPAPTRDENSDGRIDERDRTVPAAGAPGGQPVVTDRADDQATYRSSAVATGGDPVSDAERGAAASATTRPVHGEPRPDDGEPGLERTVDLDRDRTAERPVSPVVADVDGRGRREPVPPVTDADRTPDGSPVVAGPKPRASLLASLGLIVGVAGALFVLTGTLAGYGIALGAFGAVLAVLGLLATRRRHIAGKTDALLGIGFGLAAVVLGVLAMTGQFDWPTTDGDWVQRFREWLDSQFADRF